MACKSPPSTLTLALLHKPGSMDRMLVAARPIPSLKDRTYSIDISAGNPSDHLSRVL
ncbi:hypothetical protein BAUCODRAFT_29376 [Baudoinia panamericana UAMH 10762]|uniref:Uncharacterized protein n=1 Tax=Baudoinia panamericana (strain UAMH 10762) TaxID=717646 RepID=M2MVJ1_BAUPA|nr:uncharacterized protein BAUCODRAFT_29376 [Baudoinia panamericana UAMH 10762]EMD00987.1 hypothetical protein BAUCODRAFT_29376 [Baudoinia panamericana UAMH 10762]